MAVNFSASGASRLLLADGDAYASFLAPLAHDFPECLAAKSIPFFPQIVVPCLGLESAKGMTALDRSKKRGSNVISFYLVAKLVHDVPLVHLEATWEREIPVCGFDQDRQFGFFLLPIWKQLDLIRFRFTE